MRRRDRIDCASDEIHDLEAVRAYPWLRELRLRVASPHRSAEHALSDLSPLAELHELEVVEVPRSRVADLAPLAGLTGLRQLDLSRTREGRRTSRHDGNAETFYALVSIGHDEGIEVAILMNEADAAAALDTLEAIWKRFRAAAPPKPGG